MDPSALFWKVLEPPSGASGGGPHVTFGQFNFMLVADGFASKCHWIVIFVHLFSAFWPLCELFKSPLLKAGNIEFIPSLLFSVSEIQYIVTKRAFVQLPLTNPCPVLGVLQGLFAQI